MTVPTINKDGGRRDIVLLRAFIKSDIFSIPRSDGTIGRAEIDTYVFHAFTFLSITVPSLRMPFGPIMIGSSI